MKKWNGFQRGVNLGGWFSQCDHSIERYDNFITDSDFDVIKSWGLDHVRLPIDYELIESEEGDILESGYVRLEQAIYNCERTGLNMILDLHKTCGYSFYDGYGENGFFNEPDLQERFYVLWERLAQRFGKKADMIAFELLNEVTDKAYCDEWNRISHECIRRIRRYAPDIKILVGGYYNNSVSAVKDLAMPFDENVIYNFHCYEPLIFTHQGAAWIPTMDTSFRIPLSATYAEMENAGSRMLQQVSTGFKDFDPSLTLTSEYFEKIFSEALKTASERNVALYCGEYGVIELSTPEDTVKWYKMINEIFEKYGIGRAAWSYKEMDFGLSDPRLDDVRDELLKYL